MEIGNTMLPKKKETKPTHNHTIPIRSKVPTILAIGAHPDDIEVGCGGTIKALTDLGYKVYGVILTDGERGGNKEKRLKEAFVSARILGLENIFFEHLEDGKVPFNVDTVAAIEKHIENLHPWKVFTHTNQDRHQDHWSCSHATQAAARKGVREVLMYEIYGSTTSSFVPHYVIDISETIESKLSSLKVHQSQIGKGVLNIEGIREHAGSVGKEYGYKYAETFEINHLLFDRERLTLEFDAIKHANNSLAPYHYYNQLKAKTEMNESHEIT